jgi:diguanylate cyclase (GGDEF)-like protein
MESDAKPVPTDPAPDPQVDELASVLSEFARTLLTDFSIQEILDHLVMRIVEALPVTAVGVSLISPGGPPRYVAASSDQGLDYVRLQASLRQGPCVEAFETGTLVRSPDLSQETRFPDFVATAMDLGLRAVFSAPMQHSSGRLGTLDLYRDEPGPLSERDLVSAQTLADVATAYVLIATAREEVRVSAELFRESSLHDPLTGLPNRLLLIQRMKHAGQRAQRAHSVAAVLFVDLDDFKRVNDTHGHEVGDHLLVAVAERLLTLVQPGDTVARLSGDEFLVLCEDLLATDDVEDLASSIDRAFSEPFSLPYARVPIRASIGIAYSAPGLPVTVDLIREADTAMYRAKRQRRAAELTSGSPSRHRPARPDDDLAEDLRAALAGASPEHVLDLSYQPVVRPVDGLVVGVEALLRWRHASRGPVPAPQVVSVAEHAGLIDDLGDWVLRRACADRAGWGRDRGAGPVDLGVNLSTVQLLNPTMVRRTQDALAELEIDPSTLVVEITESILIQDGERALVVLDALKSLGVRIALDDFGTGYSSLTHLHRFPVDIVKIDRSFVERTTLDPAAVAIVRAVTDLAHELGLRVVAEGAQTRRQVDQLIELRCDSVQGYFFARPMSASDLGALLAAGPAATALPVA